MVAHFYVTWEEFDDSLGTNGEGLKYNMKRSDRFDLEELEGLLRLLRHIRNILDWGKGSLLREFQKALDFIHEEDQRMVAVSENC